MSATAASQLRRLLQLIPRLADGEDHPFDEVAALAGVEPGDVGTLIADLAAIAERYDVPGAWVEGVRITIDSRTVCVESNHFQRPMRLTMSELCALELGLAVLRSERSPDELVPIETAIGRLRKVITRVPANDAWDGVRHAALSAPGSVEHLSTVRNALREGRKVRLGYRKSGAAEPSERTICPYSLVFSSGMWYVVAFCEESRGFRFFRLDRIEGARKLSTPFERVEPSPVERLLEDGRAFHAERATTMRVRYSPRIARWIAEREGKTVDADGSLTMEHPLADVEWAVRHVLQYGPDAEVLEPGEVREEIARRLEAMLA